MAKTESQTKFGELLKHITTYLENKDIVDIVTEEKNGDPTDEKNVATSVSIVFKHKGQSDKTEPLAKLECYYTINETITPYFPGKNLSYCVTRGNLNKLKNFMPEIVANTLSISWVNVSKNERGKGYGLLILIYCICHVNAKNNIDYFNLDDDSNAANSMSGNIYRKLGFIPLPTELINLNPDNSTIYDSTGGPELFVPLQCYERGDYEDMIGRLLLKKFPLLNKFPLPSDLSRTQGGPMKGNYTNNTNNTNSRFIPYGGSGSAAKYTLKELKDIAVSNKIKITKKIDNKTLYLNKADLIKKLKKHKLL
jgi:hypothetical protein